VSVDASQLVRGSGRSGMPVTTPVDSAPKEMRIGLVLSAGGLRGTAHLGVLRRILYHQIPIDVIVGVSAGAIIAAYYAAVGLTVNEMVDQAPVFRGRHIIMHGLTLRASPALKPYLRRFCGIIPERLRQLEAGSFHSLHHGVQQLGIVCHDLIRNQPCYFSTTEPQGARLADVVRASAAVPGVLPSRAMTLGGRQVQLADGGISDSLPIAFAQSPGLEATHLIVSDCRREVSTPPPVGDHIVYIRPELNGIRPLRAPGRALMSAVWQGEAAVTDDLVERVQSWLADRALAYAHPR
jgi:predicted acylesterase/phospholipase RssA